MPGSFKCPLDFAATTRPITFAPAGAIVFPLITKGRSSTASKRSPELEDALDTAFCRRTVTAVPAGTVIGCADAGIAASAFPCSAKGTLDVVFGVLAFALVDVLATAVLSATGVF